jgi:hypothetical protein
VRCQSCGVENVAQSVYCGQCRAALARPCRICGEPVPLDASACLACGASFAAAAPHSAPSWGPPVQLAPVYRPAPVGGGASARDSVVGRTGSARSERSEGTGFSGVVRDLRQRDHDDAGMPMTVLDFRIERHDASGNRLVPMPVQMQGQSFSGAVNNGDEIRVTKGKWRDGTLRVDHLDNVTTGASVRAGRRRGWTVVSVVVFVVFLAAVGAFAIAWIRADGGFDQRPQPPSWFCQEAERNGGAPPPGC